VYVVRSTPPRFVCVLMMSFPVFPLRLRTADITSLVHTFPFIINDIMMGEMVSQYKLSPWYWTGVAALVPQVRCSSLNYSCFFLFLFWLMVIHP
jgi:hypothetical protein